MKRPRYLRARTGYLIGPMMALALLTGCVAGAPPELGKPPPILPEAYFFAPAEPQRAELASLLPRDDPAFASLSRLALEASPTLGEARARVAQARSGADRIGAERLPFLAGTGAVEGNRTNPDQFGTQLPPGISIDSERLVYSANISARWDPDIFGVLQQEERAAFERLNAAEANAAAVRLALISEIAGTVIDWRTLNATQARLKSDLALAENLVAIADARERFGLGRGLDRLRLQGEAAGIRTRLAAAAGEQARLLGRLITLSAQQPADVMRIMQETPRNAGALPDPPASLPSELLTNRPDILGAQAILAAEDADLAALARQRFPRFELSAVLGVLSFDLDGLFSSRLACRHAHLIRGWPAFRFRTAAS